MSKLFIIILFFSSLVHAELSPDNDIKKVAIKGESLTAHQVLKQVESQLNMKIELDAPDQFAYKKSYHHEVSLDQVLQAVVDYYREYNKINLEIVRRGNRRIILRELMDEKPAPVKPLSIASERVDKEVEPDKPDLLVSFDEPNQPLSEMQPEVQESSKEPTIEYEIRDLVVLENPGEINPINPPAVIDESKNSRKSKAKAPVKMVDAPLPKLSLKKVLAPGPIEEEQKAEMIQAKPEDKRVLKIELVGDLVEFDDEVLREPKELVVSKERSISKRLGEEKSVDKIATWKESLSSEWRDSPKVEQGYFGAYSPWSKPTLLSYRIDQPYQAKFKVSFGVGSHEDVDLAFEGIDVRTQKLTLDYGLTLSESLLVYTRLGLVNHDGQMAANGFVYRLNQAGLTDSVIGFNYIPDNFVDAGAVSFGFELSLPTGEDSDFAGSGALNATASSGYHLAFGRWRTQTQLNLSLINHFEAFSMPSKNFVFSYDLGVAYYHNEYLDFGWNLHWADSPWENGRGIWGEDGLIFQTVIQSHAWTDPLSFYVDVGLYGAVPDFGGGLQWLKEFQ